MDSLTNLKSIFPRRDLEVDLKRFERELSNQDISRARISIIRHRSRFRDSRSNFDSLSLLLISFEAHETCVNSRDQAHENRSVDSAFHKERLSRCVDDITFLPTGPRYIVNIRAGGAHFSDEILRKNRHFDVIRVIPYIIIDNSDVAQYVIVIDISRVYILCKNFSYKKNIFLYTFRTFPYLCTT